MKKSFLLLFCLTFHLTHADQEKLTLQKALAFAKEHNGQIKQTFLELKKAQVEVDHAVGTLLPTVGLSYERTLTHSSADKGLVVEDNVVSTNTEFAGTISWRILDSGERFFRLMTARKLAEAQKQKTLFDFRKKMIEVHQEYLKVLKFEEALKIASQQLQDSKKILQQTQIAADAGQLPKKDILQAKVSFLNAQTEGLTANDEVAISRADLKAILGLPLQATLPELAAVEIPKGLQNIPKQDQAVQIGLKERPDLNAMRKEIEAQKLRVQDEEIHSKINVTLDAAYTKSFSSGGFNGTSIILGFKFPILTPYLSQPLVAKQKIILKSLEEGLRQSESNAQAEIESAYHQLQSSMQRLKSSAEALDVAKQNYQMFLEAQMSRAATLLEVITARKSLYTSETNHSQAFYDAIKTKTLLEFVMGQPVPGEA